MADLITLADVVSEYGCNYTSLVRFIRHTENAPKPVKIVKCVKYFNKLELMQFFENNYPFKKQTFSNQLAMDFCRNIGRGVRYG